MKTKKFFVIGALAAVVLSSTSALAKTEYPDGAIWKHGTTGLFGGGTLYSEYYNYDHTYSYASVINAKGVSDDNTQSKPEVFAKASVKAVALKTDHAYYNYWD